MEFAPMDIRYRRVRVVALAIATALGGGVPAAAEITRGPYLQSLLDTSVVIVWKTDARSAGTVSWTGPDAIPREAGEGSPSTDHRVALNGLSPGVAYRYRILDGATAISNEFGFQTAPPPGEETVTVAVAGDTGSGDSNQRAVAAVIEGMEPDLFVQTGDIDYIDDVDRAIFGPYRTILPQTCFYPCMGNDGDPDQDWPGLFALPFDGPREDEVYYSFDWGSAHFTAVDGQGDLTEGSTQRAWLEGDLGSARERRIPWIIVYFHRAPYTVGYYATNSKTAEIRRLMTPLIDRFGVDLVLNGHDHNYQRTYPVRDGAVIGEWQDPRYASPGGAIYVVTGGGGRTLYREQKDADHTLNRIFVRAFHAVELVIVASRIDARAISLEGEVIDSFSIEKGFIRGDADGNGSIGIADAVALLARLFGAPAGPVCLDRLDANDDGWADVSDAAYLLLYLFRRGAAPPAPFPQAGADPTADSLWCR